MKLLLIEKNQSNYFNHYSTKENWICFDFKEHRVIPTDYKIRSINESPGWDHPKNWVIEASNDNKTWETIDEVTDCPYLNGKSLVHTFKIQIQSGKKFQYIRMRLSGVNWCNRINYLSFESFEIYGELMK